MAYKRSQDIDLGKMVQSIIAEYGAEVERTLARSIPEVANRTVSELKRTSPKETGDYARGWTAEATKSTLGRQTVVIYNANKPTLTHLLENGHVLRQGGRAKAFKHIKPRSDYAEELLMKKIEGELK